jgi:regulator of protease activity HflC (stomatin/prohibitin superfamily)
VDERARIFRLGRLSMALINPGAAGNGPGLIWLLPITEKPVKMRSPPWP